MTKMPPAGYPAFLQYLQSGRVSKLGGDGFIAIDAKTELMEYYRLAYGFEKLGHSQRMILTTGAAARLIGTYGGRPADE